MNNKLSKEQNDIIEKIDHNLTLLLRNMKYEDYLSFLKSNDYLETYDDVLGYCEINYFPDAFLSGLTVDFLNKVLNITIDKVNELNIKE
ncbi:MAG: hypothetical protein IKH54_07700 [Bacilli bacterium]|nr:hypothetical protein [Bacilli bacterium]